MKTKIPDGNPSWVPDWFEKRLIEFAVPSGSPEWMRKMILYTLTAGGKRFRPALVFSVARDLNLPEESVADIAVAVELLHSASLIHDDLPSIDNDDYRRGKPACHRVYGEGPAIVIADIMFFQAFALISRIEKASVHRDLYRMFSQAAVYLGMGELADIKYEGERPKLESIIEMYRMKTGALLGFCLGAPFLIACKNDLAEGAYTLGIELGTAYQIYDDVKDAIGSRETLGKTPGKDIKQKKSTVLIYWDLAQAVEYADGLFENVVFRLEALGACQTASLLRQMKQMLKTR